MPSVFQDHSTARRQSSEELSELIDALNDKTRYWSDQEALINERASRRFEFPLVVDRVSRTYSTTESSLRDGYTLEGRIAQLDVNVRIELPKQLNDQVSNLERGSTFAVEGVLNRWVSVLKRLEFWGLDPADAAADVTDPLPRTADSPPESAGGAEAPVGNLSILEQARRQGAFQPDDDEPPQTGRSSPRSRGASGSILEQARRQGAFQPDDDEASQTGRSSPRSRGASGSILEQARRQGAFQADDDGGRPRRSAARRQPRRRSQTRSADPTLGLQILVCLMFIAPLYLSLVFIALGCVAGVLLSLFALFSGEANNVASMIGMLLALVLFGGLGYPSCLGAYHATRGLPKVIPWLRKSLLSQSR